jgi:hypothetical protein
VFERYYDENVFQNVCTAKKDSENDYTMREPGGILVKKGPDGIFLFQTLETGVNHFAGLTSKSNCWGKWVRRAMDNGPASENEGTDPVLTEASDTLESIDCEFAIEHDEEGSELPDISDSIQLIELERLRRKLEAVHL